MYPSLRTVSWSTLLILATLLTGCDLLGIGVNERTVVSGVVLDQTSGEPLAGIDVFISSGCSMVGCDVSDTGRTGANGRFRLDAASSDFRYVSPIVHVNYPDGFANTTWNTDYQTWMSAGQGLHIEPGTSVDIRVELCRFDVLAGECIP